MIELLSWEEYVVIVVMLDFFQCVFIDGGFCDVCGGCIFVLINLIIGELLVQVVVCDVEDVGYVVVSVWWVFEDGCWCLCMFVECKVVLLCLVELLEEYLLELVVMESFDSGKLICECQYIDLLEIINILCWYVELIDKIYDSIVLVGLVVLVMVVCELIGVVGLVLLWNFLLLMFVWKIGLVLVVGCFVVVKLVFEISLIVLCVVELVSQVGIFVGVFNVVFGGGCEVGELLGCYLDVVMVSFIGFIVIGCLFFKYVVEFNFKWVVLECGGKNLVVVMNDVEDFDLVV